MTGIRNQESLLRPAGYGGQAGVSRTSIAVGSCRLLSIALGLLLAVPAFAQQNATTELTDKAAEAIDKGLKHLLQMQRADGSWAAGDEGERAMAITSLSLMAFMSKAQFPGSGPNGDALNRAKDWLLKQAEDAPDGYLGATMYEHGLATLALTELWGMTRDKEEDDQIQKAIEAAVAVILRSQTNGGGWRYQPVTSGGQDTSVTVMVFIGLASARQAGIMVPNETITKVVAYFESATSHKTGGFNYIPRGKKNNDSIACTGGGAYAAQLAGARGSEMVLSALRFLTERSPGIITGDFGSYYYGHYYAIHAMVQAGDAYYAKWYPQIRDALIKKQDASGAWGAGKNTKGNKAVSYETPMAIIILATPYRYIPIYQR
ncbi:MAG: terpene cyclase/mutase family protein [Verrucomicrobia bacterium]|jgi:hypothetical protein|nr:terpene cyclase/mutase family protein [Verrucomicrobiota bacterium]MBT7065259.1 terpene cyclase/mutase family protein [Verrucomicrobiota bacterium]MBT7701717.1 terpene cyclase/mutase family protein [Verrucomicrobiota bacterium]